MRQFFHSSWIKAVVVGCAVVLVGWSSRAAQPPLISLWAFATTDPILASPAIGSDGTIYVGSYDRKLHAITPAGSNRWAFPLPSGGFSGIYSSPALGPDGTIYFGGEDGNLYRSEEHTFELQYRRYLV